MEELRFFPIVFVIRNEVIEFLDANTPKIRKKWKELEKAFLEQWMEEKNFIRQLAAKRKETPTRFNY